MAQTKKYLMFISYVGSPYRGSQIQLSKDSNSIVETVQYFVEKGLKYVFQLPGERPLYINLASRTDKGVHAFRAAISATLPKFRSDFIKPGPLVKLLNDYLSKATKIRILEAQIVPDSFQFNKVNKEKVYLYRFGLLKKEFFAEHRKKIIPIIEANRTHLISYVKEFDLKKAQEATYLFEGVKDFGAIVGKPSKNICPTTCCITSFKAEEGQPLFPLDPESQKFNFYHFIIKGDRFLYQMVRRMVALTIGVGFNNLNLSDIQKLFDNPVPSSWPQKGVQIVPGHGLYLIDTNIDLEKFIQRELENENKEVHLNINNEELVN